MHLRPGRLVLLTLPAAALLLPPSPAAADGPEPETFERCWGFGLSDEEVAAGAVTEVFCETVPVGSPILPFQSRGSTFALATHFDYAGGYGDSYTSYDTTCDSNFVAAGWGSIWDNRFSSTLNWSCGNAKHFTNYDGTGGGQNVTGPTLTVVDLGSPENDAVSSVAYA